MEKYQKYCIAAVNRSHAIAALGLLLSIVIAARFVAIIVRMDGVAWSSLEDVLSDAFLFFLGLLAAKISPRIRFEAVAIMNAPIRADSPQRHRRTP